MFESVDILALLFKLNAFASLRQFRFNRLRHFGIKVIQGINLVLRLEITTPLRPSCVPHALHVLGLVKQGFAVLHGVRIIMDRTHANAVDEFLSVGMTGFLPAATFGLVVLALALALSVGLRSILLLLSDWLSVGCLSFLEVRALLNESFGYRVRGAYILGFSSATSNW